jgi:hypothetical protein
MLPHHRAIPASSPHQGEWPWVVRMRFSRRHLFSRTGIMFAGAALGAGAPWGLYGAKAGGAAPVPSIGVRYGRNFAHLLPSGWQVIEEGNYVLFCASSDRSAGTFVYDITGAPYMVDPMRFIEYVLMNVSRIQSQIQVGAVWSIRPLSGYNSAIAGELQYAGQDGERIATAFCNLAVAYQTCSGVIHLASYQKQRFADYAGWLPQVAIQAVNIGPNPFGATVAGGVIRGIAERERAAFADFREWSRVNWDEVTQQPAASDAWRQSGLDPVLTGHEWNGDPFGGADTRDSTTPAIIWTHPSGARIESADPSFDPRTPQDQGWQRVR